MRRLAQVRSWLRASLRRGDFERGMDEELRMHIECYEADLRSAGLSTAEAHRRARAEFGSAEARKEECRDAFGLRLAGQLRTDATFALRLLRRSPAFTVVALLSLGLGIGANTAIFTLIDTVIVKRLPVADPGGLFFIDNSGGKSGGSSGPPYPCFELLRDHNQLFSGMAAFRGSRFKMTIADAAEQVRGQYVSGGYFDVLGIGAIRGRVLTAADDAEPEGGEAPAVISHSFWKRRFAMDPAILGRTLLIGTHPVAIVGVTPPGFSGLQVGSPIDISVPMRLSGNSLRSKQLWWFSVVGRIKPGAPIGEARADLDRLFKGYMTEVGAGSADRYFSGIELVPADKGLNELRRQFAQPLLIVMGIVVVVLLIGCANVANLLLARASARRTEMSVRLAIGASRGRLIAQLLTEGFVLVGLGAVGGLVFARWGVSFLLGMIFSDSPDGLPVNPRFDLRVLAFTAAVALLTALLFSLAPALRATRRDANPIAVRTGAARPGRLGPALVVVQVMLSVILLGAAALFVRTLHELNTIESGFRRDGVLVMPVETTVPGRNLAPATAEDHRREHARLGAIWQEFIARVAGLPGVTSAAVATMSPLTGRDRGVRIAVIDAPVPADRRQGDIHVNQITAGYFETLGIPVLTGRPFTVRDRAGAPRVAILNETANRTYFLDANPIGRRVNLPGQRVEDEYEIVGVVRDVRYENLRKPDERMIYLPIEQSIDPITNAIVLATGPGDVTDLAPPLRDTVRAALPAGFVTQIATIQDRVEMSLIRERLLSLLAAFFGALALVLAAIGLYGVMAYSVLRRTREIGVRIAVGAGPQSVVWMVVRETLALVVAGAAMGSAAAVAASRYVESQLFGVTAGDPLALSAAVLSLLIVALAAAYLPARRASRIDPATALRYEG